MVKKSFSTTWNRSIQPRKQRKYRHNAPLHTRQKMVHAHLSPVLRKKYHLRNIQLKKGDKIKILKGEFKKKECKVEKISLKYSKVYLTGIEKIKTEGAKVHVPFDPSNLMIIELNLDDKKRKLKLESKTSPKITANKKETQSSESNSVKSKLSITKTENKGKK